MENITEKTINEEKPDIKNNEVKPIKKKKTFLFKKPKINKNQNPNQKEKKQFFKKNQHTYLNETDDVVEDFQQVLSPEEIKIKDLSSYIFNYIKAKTGKNENLFFKKLDEINHFIKITDLKTQSGTNILGMCILYDDVITFDKLTTLINDMSLPYIANASISALLDKSPLLNQIVIDFFDKKNQLTEIKNMFLNNAAFNLFREETIDIYINKILINCLDSEKEIFISNVVEKNNKPILFSLCKNKEFKNVILSKIDNSVHQDTKIWVKKLLKNNDLVKEELKNINQFDVNNKETKILKKSKKLNIN